MPSLAPVQPSNTSNASSIPASATTTAHSKNSNLPATTPESWASLHTNPQTLPQTPDGGPEAPSHRIAAAHANSVPPDHRSNAQDTARTPRPKESIAERRSPGR